MNLQNEIFKKICKASSNVGIAIDDVSEDEVISNYINDSLTFVSFMIEIENCFEIQIPDEFLLDENITFDCLYNLINDLKVK